VAPGTYRVSATWTASADRASDAPFTVLNGITTLASVRVNQRLAPADLSDHGAMWEDLGTFTISAGTLTVRLSNVANGNVIADAIRLEAVTPSASAAVTADRAPGAATRQRLAIRRSLSLLGTSVTDLW
jgi:hypothetical protein